MNAIKLTIKWLLRTKVSLLNTFKLVLNLVQQGLHATLISLPISEKSSTRITWPINSSGDRSRTECTVRNSTVHASLWKHMITSVGGRLFGYRSGSLHLKNTKFYFSTYTILLFQSCNSSLKKTQLTQNE